MLKKASLIFFCISLYYGGVKDSFAYNYVQCS